MKLLLQQSRTRLDYAVAQQWTANVRSALDSGDLERAVKKRLRGVYGAIDRLVALVGAATVLGFTPRKTKTIPVASFESSRTGAML